MVAGMLGGGGGGGGGGSPENTKFEKRDHLFYNKASLKKPHSFYQPQLTQH